MNKCCVGRAVIEEWNTCHGRVRNAITKEVGFVWLMSRNSDGRGQAVEKWAKWKNGEEMKIQDMPEDEVCAEMTKWERRNGCTEEGDQYGWNLSSFIPAWQRHCGQQNTGPQRCLHFVTWFPGTCDYLALRGEGELRCRWNKVVHRLTSH